LPTPGKAPGNAYPGLVTAFGEMLRQLREEHGISLSAFADSIHYNKGYLSRVERGLQSPSEDVARLCDAALNARGDLVAAAHLDIAAMRDSQPWQTTELLRRIQASDTASCTLDALRATVDQLCCEYPYRDANELIGEARDWLRHIAHVLRKPTSLREHRELLVSAGWLAALTACLEYDLGLRTSAQATRAAARQLAGEADHGEIMAWTYEMESWFALTQRRYRDTITEARAGEEVSPSHPVVVQLIAQEAKALGRMHDPDGVRAALDRGQRLLDGFPAPERPEHHFVVDPSKWVFYAMDAYRMAGDDRLAEEYARQVLANSIGPDGVEHAPMRIAEARLTLATVAARRGDLEQATTLGLEALRGPRKSLPSLLMMAGELDVELDRRYPNEPATVGFREALRRIH
jgi:transcriptional regulator with XRE-family HTH domain